MRQILHQQNHITLQRYFRHFGYLDSYPSHNTIWSGSNSYCSTVATPDIDPESYSVTRRTRGPAADGMGLMEPWYWQHGDGTETDLIQTTVTICRRCLEQPTCQVRAGRYIHAAIDHMVSSWYTSLIHWHQILKIIIFLLKHADFLTPVWFKRATT